LVTSGKIHSAFNFAVIFDMDGTLVDNASYHFKAWQALLIQNGKGNLNEETYHKEINGVPIMNTLKNIFGDDTNEALLKELRKEKEDLYKTAYEPFIRPINGLENFLSDLKNAGIKMAIASSSTINSIDFVLSHVPIRQYFDVIIDGERVSRPKPNPQIFIKAADDLHMLYDRCIVFEDSLSGIKAANSAGMKVAGITTSHKAWALQPASLIINDYTGLTWQKLAQLF
jgi:beta-phosphoglucomutase family hydrolase